MVAGDTRILSGIAAFALVLAGFALLPSASLADPAGDDPFHGGFFIRATVIEVKDPATHKGEATRTVLIEIIVRGDLDSGGCIGGTYENATVASGGTDVDHSTVERGEGFIKIKSTAKTVVDERFQPREVREYSFTVTVNGAKAACFIKNKLTNVQADIKEEFKYSFTFLHVNDHAIDRILPFPPIPCNEGSITSNGGNCGGPRPVRERRAEGPLPWLPGRPPHP